MASRFSCLIDLPDQRSTEALAKKLAPLLRPGDCLCLEGGLGGGKSTFARALIRTLRRDEALTVPSPTFSLVQVYPDASLPVTHADLYRLGGEDDCEQLDLFTLNDGLLLIEWPDRAGALIPESRLVITFSLSEDRDPDKREAEIKTYDQDWTERLQAGFNPASIVRNSE